MAQKQPKRLAHHNMLQQENRIGKFARAGEKGADLFAFHNKTADLIKQKKQADRNHLRAEKRVERDFYKKKKQGRRAKGGSDPFQESLLSVYDKKHAQPECKQAYDQIALSLDLKEGIWPMQRKRSYAKQQRRQKPAALHAKGKQRIEQVQKDERA